MSSNLNDMARIHEWVERAMQHAEANQASLGVVEAKLTVSGEYCDHLPVVLDEKSRTCSCVACGATLDPFWVLLQYGRAERFLETTRAQAKDEHDKLQGSLQRVRDEIAKLRARRTKLRDEQKPVTRPAERFYRPAGGRRGSR